MSINGSTLNSRNKLLPGLQSESKVYVFAEFSDMVDPLQYCLVLTSISNSSVFGGEFGPMHQSVRKASLLCREIHFSNVPIVSHYHVTSTCFIMAWLFNYVFVCVTLDADDKGSTEDDNVLTDEQVVDLVDEMSSGSEGCPSPFSPLPSADWNIAIDFLSGACSDSSGKACFGCSFFFIVP